MSLPFHLCGLCVCATRVSDGFDGFVIRPKAFFLYPKTVFAIRQPIFFEVYLESRLEALVKRERKSAIRLQSAVL